MELERLKKTIIKDIEECEDIEDLGRTMLSMGEIVQAEVLEYWEKRH